MKKILLIALMLLPLVASAEIVEIDGIWYNIIVKGNFAEVTKNPSDGEYESSYTGKIVIPDKVSYEGIEYIVNKIGKRAFQNSDGLISLTISDNVTTIGEKAFAGCSSLNSISIPKSVSSIEKEAFYYCGIQSISIPNSVINIGEGAFEECPELTSVTISNSVSSIEQKTFSGCI